MKTNPFGRTGLEISEIAFGGGVTGGILINADETTRQAALARAIAGGINWIDSGRFDAAQIYYNAINPSAAWTRAPAGWKGQDFSGVIAACKRHHMGMLNIRVFAGGPLARAQRPDRLAVLTSGTDVDNEVRC